RSRPGHQAVRIPVDIFHLHQRGSSGWSRRVQPTARLERRLPDRQELALGAPTRGEGDVKLTDEQIQQFREEGYLILPALLPAEKVARYRTIFDEVVERSRSMTKSGDGYNLAPDAEGRPIPVRLHKIQGV